MAACGLLFLATGPERKIHAYDRDTGAGFTRRHLKARQRGQPPSIRLVPARPRIITRRFPAGGSAATAPARRDRSHDADVGVKQKPGGASA